MPEHLRRTKIVATLGPACDDPDVLVRMIVAGMDVARLNLSHGEPAEHRARLAALEKAVRRTSGAGGQRTGGWGTDRRGTDGRRVGVLFDLRGPEMRLGTFAGGSVTLTPGQIFHVTTDEVAGGPDRAAVDYPGFPKFCRPGDHLVLDDGRLVLEVVETTENEIACRVLVGGVLGDRKKINLPGRRLDVPYLTPKDERDLELAVSAGADFVAASFTRRAEDIVRVREFLRARGGNQMVVAKIESQEALENLDSVIEAADAVMVARGDLGVEVPEEDVPVIQKDIIARSVAAGKPVITATQMLESMVARPRPTRAEASDVANAIFDGTDAVMLSAETAAGRYPVEAVETMARIAERAEEALGRVYGAADGVLGAGSLAGGGGIGAAAAGFCAGRWAEPLPEHGHGVTEAISLATVTIARELGAGAIVTATTSGFTARMVARHRPAAPIIAVTSNETVARQQTLTWGVFPFRVPEASSTDEMFLRAATAARQSGLVEPGSIVVITAGAPPGTVGTTNIIKVVTLGRVLARGNGLVPESATGVIRVCRTAEEAAVRVLGGDILVARDLDETFFPAMQRAGGWVVEEAADENSFAAVQARALGRVAIAGAAGATRALVDGGLVTLDGARGLVYEGRASVL